MNRNPVAGDIVQVPAKRGDMIVVDAKQTPEGWCFYAVPAAKADKVTGEIDADATIMFHTGVTAVKKAVLVNLFDVRLIGQAKVDTHTTYKVVRRKDIV